MENILNFISTHYQLIINLVLLLISVVVFILRKRPVNAILTIIYQLCIAAINDTEIYSQVDPNLTSADKLNHALVFVEKCLIKSYPEIDINRYHFIIKDCIEAILSTPQKKG